MKKILFLGLGFIGFLSLYSKIEVKVGPITTKAHLHEVILKTHKDYAALQKIANRLLDGRINTEKDAKAFLSCVYSNTPKDASDLAKGIKTCSKPAK